MIKGRILLAALSIVLYVFFHCFNGNQILRGTQKASSLEKSFKAELNINTELMIEHDDLISGRNISSLVPDELSKYVPKQKAQNLVIVQERHKPQSPDIYCIIDLLTPKAEAVTTVLPD